MQCPKCGHESSDGDNFCKDCGSKLKNECNCWVKKKGNYNCGCDSCPGYGLFRNERLNDDVVNTIPTIDS